MLSNSMIELAEVDIPQTETPTEQTETETPQITSQTLQELNDNIIELNSSINLLNESVCNNTGTIEVIDYSPKIDDLLNRTEIIATNSTVFIAGTGIILVLFILYSAIRKFVDY